MVEEEKFIPLYVLSEILFQLPALSILRFECVCKTWRSLVKHDPHFARLHLHHQQQQQHQVLNNNHGFISFYVSDGDDKKKVSKFQYLEYVNDKHYNDVHMSQCKVKKLNMPLFNGDHTRVSSCNGLVCLEDRHAADPILICNPLTREYISLPRDLDYKTSFSCINNKKYLHASGFGYHPRTDEYKVIRIYYPSAVSLEGQVQVYTIGTDRGRWRDKGLVPHKLVSNQQSVLVSGTLYWLTELGGIVSFDLEHEKFNDVPGPPVDSSSNLRILTVLGGNLSICRPEGEIDDSLHVWVLKNKTTWTKKFSISNNEMEIWLCKPCALLRTGEVLLWYYDSRYLLSYDQNTGKIKAHTVGEEHLTEKYSCIGAVPHITSFISLKSLGIHPNKIKEIGQLKRKDPWLTRKRKRKLTRNFLISKKK